MAEGGLDVIYDSGRCVPASPFLAYLVSLADAPEGVPVMPGLRFPIVSRLNPGILQRQRQVFDARWMADPVFVLGADSGSLRWLGVNRLPLVRLGAWGLVAQAADAGQFRLIQASAPELKFAPVSGDWFDARLIGKGVTVYPVLIDTDGVARQNLSVGRYGPDGRARPRKDRP
jgi:integrating conjugative element protein (TIGR03765 family)